MDTGVQLKQTLDEYRRLGIAEQVDYDKFYLYSLVTHSTAIEGSTVTEVENQLLFDEGLSAKGRTMQEQLMNLDLKKAYEEGIRLAKTHADFSVGMLCALSAVVMRNTGSVYNAIQGTFDASRGDLRLVNVTAGAGGQSYMSWQKVPDRLASFCSRLNEERRRFRTSGDVVEQYLMTFDAHYELVTIHPWVDGNGRMARLVMNMLQWELGLVPVRVNREDKAEYIQALVDSREGETAAPFREFMFREHVKNLQAEIVNSQASRMDALVDEHGGQEMSEVDRKGGQKTRSAIIDMIARDAGVTTMQMAARLGINRSAVAKHIKRLQDAGVIRREGPDKGGKWVIMSDNN